MWSLGYGRGRGVDAGLVVCGTGAPFAVQPEVFVGAGRTAHLAGDGSVGHWGLVDEWE